MEWSGSGTIHSEMGWNGHEMGGVVWEGTMCNKWNGVGPCVTEWFGNGLGTMQLNGSDLEMRLYTVDRTRYNIPYSQKIWRGIKFRSLAD